jgi:hypothetical protein
VTRARAAATRWRVEVQAAIDDEASADVKRRAEKAAERYNEGLTMLREAQAKFSPAG